MDEPTRPAADEELLREVLSGMQTWRQAHPRASLAAIEHAVEHQLARLRAHLVEHAALASPSADVGARDATARPRCPTCGGPLVERGQHTRTLTVRGNHPVHLRRSYAECPSCGTGLFPPR
jgi:YgiT-type zinc finger domain-containing protein